jgi:H+/Cl- antiporter ClcA
VAADKAMPSLFARSKDLSFSLVLGGLVGLVGAGVAIAFLKALSFANDARVDNGWLIYLLPVAGLGIGLTYHHFGNHVSRGNNLVLEEIHEPGTGVPRRMAPMVFAATFVSHLFGASTGREGAGIQITSSIVDGVARLFSPTLETRRLLLITSIAAAFGGLFGVPIAGVVFALEFQESGRIRYEAILSALTAALVAFYTVESFNLEHLTENAIGPIDINVSLVWKLVILAAASAAIAMSFVKATHFVHDAATRFIAWPPLRPVVGAFAVLALVALSGSRDYLGLSGPLANQAFIGATGITAAAFAWKFVFTSISLGTGFIGGEMVPLFIIGALAGAQVAVVLGASVPLFAAVGMVATFSAAANVPIACIILGVELFGANALIPFTIACVLSYVMSGHGGIYSAQKRAAVRH